MYPGTVAAAHPDRRAVIMGDGTVVTYGELDASSIRLARLLRESGLRPGDHFAVMMENHPRYCEVVWAALRSGFYVTAINSHLTAGEAAFITATYQNLLDRAPETGAVAYYENVIDPMLANLTPGTAAYAKADLAAEAQVLAYFSQSPEFRADVTVTAQNPASASHWLILI